MPGPAKGHPAAKGGAAKGGAAKGGLSGHARSFRVRGPLLYSLRVARGWTQLEAAERAGTSERLVRKAEAGGIIGFRSIAVLARLYGTSTAPLSPDELVTEAFAGPAGEVSNEADVEAIVRRWHDELWGQGRLEIITEMAAPDCTLHVHRKRWRGHVAVRRYVESTRAALREFKLVIERPAVFGNLAIVNWRIRLKHARLGVGPPGFAKQRVIHGSTWIRVAGCLVCEAWRYWESPFPPGDAG